MEPSSVATGIPSAASWYMNPYFMASFGALTALGFVLFALAYWVFVKMKVGQTPTPTVNPEERCGTCGLTGDMLARVIPCKDHSGLVTDISGIKAWIKSHEEDYRQIRKRLDDFIDNNKRRG